jgi:hypothetical protein
MWSPAFVERVLRRTLPRVNERLVLECDIAVSAYDLPLSWANSREPEFEVRGLSHAIVAWLSGRPGSWLDLVRTTQRGNEIRRLPVRPWA